MTIAINILKSLILKLENELLFFEKNTEFLTNRRMELAKEYNVGIKISAFFESVKETAKTVDDIKSAYNKFSKEIIPNSNLSIGEVFVIDEKETTTDKIAYGLRICKDSKKYMPQLVCEKMYQISEAQRTIGEKTIVNSLQVFEEYFSSILKILISIKPEAYFYEKTIKYSLLINKDINELTDELISQEVNELMYGVSDTLEKVNQIHKLKLEKYKDLWDAYVELDLRRNIIVHNEAKANQQYLSHLPERYTKPQDGAILACNEVYVAEAIETLIKFAYLLYYLIADGDDQLSFLESIAFDFLCSEKWEISLFAYDLLLAIPTLKNIDKTLYQINKLIAKKHISGLASTREEIEKLDISGMKNRFAIAKCLLLEKNEEVNEMLKLDYPESFDFGMIQTWPIFLEYRKSNEYKAFIDEHQTEYARYELKQDDPII